MSSISERLAAIRATLPQGVRLVAVSKYYPPEAVLDAYRAGQRLFGESKALDLAAKQQQLPADIEWHFIGHLQTNKVKYIAPFVALIHSVDSLRLMQEIEKQAAKCGRTIDVLLQIHIAREATKFGLTPDECRTLLAQGEWRTLGHLRLRGMMTIASNTDDLQQVRAELRSVRQLFDEAKQLYFAGDTAFDTLSAGMSDDYRIAIEEGSNCVRIGSSIFAG